MELGKHRDFSQPYLMSTERVSSPSQVFDHGYLLCSLLLCSRRRPEMHVIRTIGKFKNIYFYL